MTRRIPSLLALACCAAAFAPALAQVPPHLGEAGRTEFQDYQLLGPHRAFAIAPGGAWGWKADEATKGDAEEAAIATCQANTQQKCVLYDVDGKTVFDAKAWPKLWGPYADAAKAAAATIGHKVGERFPDIAFAEGGRRSSSVAALKGKIVVLHFWGSWCGPCRKELPDMERLYRKLKGRPDIVFEFIQVREPFSTSAKWAAAQSLSLPISESGSKSAEDATFRLTDGTRIRDREVAHLFPSTFVLDKRGLVVFSHIGAVRDWDQYREFLLDAATRSGTK